MAALICDLCGGKLIMGAGGVATCDSCGMEHSAGRMKEKVQEVKGVVQTDSSHLVSNYLDMANNAIEAGNNAEAEAYCNRIIEVDSSNYRAWMLKGEAAAWESTLANPRINEGINAFLKGIKYAPEEEKEHVAAKAKKQIKGLCIAMAELQTERFAKWPDKEEKTRILSLIDTISDLLEDFNSQSNTPVCTEDIMESIADLIDKAVGQAYKNVIYPDYKSERYPYPDDDDFYKYIARIDCCIELVTKAKKIGYSNTDDAILRCENYIYLQKKAMEACSYDWKYQDYGKEYGSTHVRKAEQIIRNHGLIPDSANSRVYYVHLSPADEIIKARRICVSYYEGYIKEIRAEQKRIEREEAQKRFDAYWEEHADEKVELEQEQMDNKNRIDALTAQISAIDKKNIDRISELSKERDRKLPCEVDADKQREVIKDLEAERHKCGIFKGKEKRIIQTRLDTEEKPLMDLLRKRAETEKKAHQDRLNAEISILRGEGKDLRDEVAMLKKRNEEISKELTKAR